MKKTAKQFTSSALVVGALLVGAGSASAATFGDSNSGASSVESYQIKYDGAAWNYAGSRWQSTSFKYTRNGKTLLSRTAYSSKVTGSVWDNLLPGETRTTYFNWSRGPLR